MCGNPIRSLLSLALALWLVLPAAQAAKPPRDDGQGYSRADEPRDARRSGLAAAVDEAQRRTGGRVLAAETQEDAHGRYYRIKVLTPNGRIRILHIGDR